MKVVINSHTRYTQPRAQLLDSVRESSFPMTDVIVVIGGVEQSSPPSTTDTSWVKIECTEEAYDFHALTCLFRYKDHPLVRADGYLYLHDTCTVERETFVQCLRDLDFSSPYTIYGPPLPAANICALARGVVERIGWTYNKHISKREAISIEKGVSATTPHLYRFGAVKPMPPRRRLGLCEPYDDGARIHYFYHKFGVHKYTRPTLTRHQEVD